MNKKKKEQKRGPTIDFNNTFNLMVDRKERKEKKPIAKKSTTKIFSGGVWK